MQYTTLPNFSGLANGARATLAIPKLPMSCGRIVLQFGGSLTLATITEIVVKVGTRVVFGPVSAAELQKVNAYSGKATHSNLIAIDFTEKDGLSIDAKEVGAYDLPSLGSDHIFIEVVNNAASGTPTLTALVGLTGRQFFKDGKNDAREQLVHKLVKVNIPQSGGTRTSWMPNFAGALLKRVHFGYTGTDWTAGANGNLWMVELRRAGYPIWDRVECLANRFIVTEQGKVPQSKWFTVDLLHDNVHSSSVAVDRNKPLEFILNSTAADTFTAYAELLDMPRNV